VFCRSASRLVTLRVISDSVQRGRCRAEGLPRGDNAGDNGASARGVSVGAWAAAINHEYLAVRQFVLTEDQLAAQDAAAYATLASFDTALARAPTASSDALEKRVGLPEICINPSG
jgi:hypothetical protein